MSKKELENMREVLLAYHKYLEGFNDPTIFNVPIEWIDNFLVYVINQNKDDRTRIK